MRNLILSIALFLGAAIIFAGCDAQKTSGPSDTGDGFLSMNVPDNFNFQTTRDINVKIKSDVVEENSIINIYNGNPNEGGAVMQRGLVRAQGEQSFDLNIGRHLDEIWVGSKTGGSPFVYTRLNLNSSGSYSLNIGQETAAIFNSSPSTVEGCNAGCDTILSGNNATISAGETACVPEGENLNNVNITFQGNGESTLRICGNVSLQNVNRNGNNTPVIEINETGSLTAQNLNLNSTDARVINDGTFNMNNNFAFNFNFENNGTANISGSFNVNSNGIGVNNGTLNVGGDLNNNNEFENYGSTIVAGNLQNNGNSTIKNYCSLIISGHLQQGAELHQYGYIEVTGNTHFNSNPNSLYLYSGSFIDISGSLHVNTTIHGPTGDYARIDVADYIRVNGSGAVRNNIDLCGYIDHMNGSMDPTVVECEAYIEVTACNPGAGSPGGSGDSDGDGVPDDEDDYPDDPDRAFDNLYPAEGVFGTLAFEDLWPSYGDYDMNDLVLDYNINEVTNADGEIVDIHFTFVVRAIGAMYRNGLGVELPVPPSAVATVDGSRLPNGDVTLSGNGTEAGQTNAVIIITEDASENMGLYVNTVNPNNHTQEDTIKVSLTFTNPVTRAELGTAPYNPFIWVDGDRGREVHLPGMPPTSLADPALFGTADDNTSMSANRFYKSNNNLNWAINVPVSIPYPLEEVDMTLAYPNFRDWAESGGSTNTGWYLDEPGNRVNSKLYLLP